MITIKIDGHAYAIAEFGDIEKIEMIMTTLDVDKIVFYPAEGDPTHEPMGPKPGKTSLHFNPWAHLLSNKMMHLLWKNTKRRTLRLHHIKIARFIFKCL